MTNPQFIREVETRTEMISRALAHSDMGMAQYNLGYLRALSIHMEDSGKPRAAAPDWPIYVPARALMELLEKETKATTDA